MQFSVAALLTAGYQWLLANLADRGVAKRHSQLFTFFNFIFFHLSPQVKICGMSRLLWVSEIKDQEMKAAFETKYAKVMRSFAENYKKHLESFEIPESAANHGKSTS